MLLTKEEVSDLVDLVRDFQEMAKKTQSWADYLQGRPLLTGTRAGLRVVSRMAHLCSEQLKEAIRFGTR